MSSPFIKLFTERVEQAIKPHREIYGEAAPVVKMGLRLLAEAEDVDRQLQGERVSTARAASLTGWSEDTLQAKARAVLAGETLSGPWANLVVEREGDAGPYVFLLSSIPSKAA